MSGSQGVNAVGEGVALFQGQFMDGAWERGYL